MDPQWWKSIPWHSENEDNTLAAPDMVNQALDYFIERCRIDNVKEYSEEEVELIREVALDVVDRLEPSTCWVLLNVISGVYSRVSGPQGPHEIKERVEGALEQAFGPSVDFKVVDMSESDDPLARLLRGMPEDPSVN